MRVYRNSFSSHILLYITKQKLYRKYSNIIWKILWPSRKTESQTKCWGRIASSSSAANLVIIIIRKWNKWISKLFSQSQFHTDRHEDGASGTGQAQDWCSVAGNWLSFHKLWSCATLTSWWPIYSGVCNPLLYIDGYPIDEEGRGHEKALLSLLSLSSLVLPLCPTDRSKSHLVRHGE